MKELLVTCPLCGQPNFTTRGLRQHWCPMKPPGRGHKKHSAPLTKSEWGAAVIGARKAAEAEARRQQRHPSPIAKP